jgi:hypothetical protein
MSFKALLEAIGDNEAAVEIAKTLEADFNANVEEIGKLESKFSEAVTTRDKTKSRLRELAEAAGVDELTAEALADLKKGGKGDDKLQAEIERLAKQLETATSEYEGKLGDADARYQSAIIDRELTKLGAGTGVIDGALEDVVHYLKAGATIDGENIVYMRDGVQERGANGRPMTISDKLEALRESKPFYFKAQGQGGSGTQHRGTGGSGKTMSRSNFEGLGAVERAQFMKDGGTLTE